jgi:cytosine/adenosine deaminase-related metal-dependent hydrolase
MNRPLKTPGPQTRVGTRVLRLDAAGAADPSGVFPTPVSVLLTPSGEVLASGSPGEVDHHPAAAGAARVQRAGAVLMPGLVNAHCHLDLSHIGPRPHDPGAGFVPWIERIRTQRCQTPEEVSASVRQGIALVVAGGTVAVGDIAGCPKGRYFLEPWRELMASGLAGVSYIECFGIGRGETGAADRLSAFLDEHEPEIAASLHRRAWVRVGLQPHAPNTVSPAHYRFVIREAARRDFVLSTHLAETPEERRFVAEGTGPQREMLEALGLWDESILEHYGRGLYPVAHLFPILAEARFLAAHVNDCPDEALELLARSATTVAYCPRASAYFGAERHFGPHRYLDMLGAKIPVALGTDSIVNLPPEAADPARGGISVLDEMRFLYARDQTEPLLLLRMATLHGAAPLGLNPALFSLRTGSRPLGILAVDINGGPESGGPLESALRSKSRPQFVFRREYPSSPR